MDLSIDLWGKTLANPLMAASGCYANGREAAEFLDLKSWGAVISSGLTREPRLGNPGPRVVETAAGMLNSVGLENPGLAAFLEEDLPFLQAHAGAVIVNVAGNHLEDYVALCEGLEDQDIFAIELNLSCPNVKAGGMAMGIKARAVEETLSACRKVTRHPLIAKLTPNVTSIAEIAQAAERGGADAVSLVNTFLGLAIDLDQKRPVLRNNTGGLSGPCIKPLALRMTAQVYQAVKIPVIGLGGIQSARDVLEFMLAGASGVEIGSGNFAHPYLVEQICQDLQEEKQRRNIGDWQDWIGQLQYWS